MSSEDEVITIRKKLEKMTEEDSDQSQALDMLKSLGKLDVNLKILTSTRIGLTINALRKNSKDEEVRTLAKSLIKTWKKFVPDNGEKKDKKPEKPKEKHSEERAEKKQPTNKNHRGEDFSLDEVRSRCRDMMVGAIKGEGELPEGSNEDKCEDLATRLESAVFEQFKQTNSKYKAQVRSRVFNLRDKKNPVLRLNLITGLVTPEKLAKMTSEEMANEEKQQERAKFEKEGLDAGMLSKIEGTKTSLLKCPDCGKRNCTYSQVQTRGADEPMTTFAVCNDCGFRWKFE